MRFNPWYVVKRGEGVREVGSYWPTSLTPSPRLNT